MQIVEPGPGYKHLCTAQALFTRSAIPPSCEPAVPRCTCQEREQGCTITPKVQGSRLEGEDVGGTLGGWGCAFPRRLVPLLESAQLCERTSRGLGGARAHALYGLRTLDLRLSPSIGLRRLTRCVNPYIFLPTSARLSHSLPTQASHDEGDPKGPCRNS